jgi:protein-S-isoprenylcysteine O-methyltransferase Ste14
MTPSLAKSIFVVALVCFALLRYPYQRRALKIPVKNSARNLTEKLLVAAATLGLGVFPMIYIVSGFPKFAEHGFVKELAYIGTLLFGLALLLFYLAHDRLGRNFSASLDIRNDHALVSSGIYSVVRHPMYLAFWLWAIAQLLLLPNWCAGLAGILGFGMLYLGRIEREEALMLQTFGEEYRTYVNSTARLVPWIY